MMIDRDGQRLFIRNVAAGKVYFMRECGAVWCSEEYAWVIDAAAMTIPRFREAYRKAQSRAPEKQIVKTRQVERLLIETHKEYNDALQTMEDCKARWLTGDVPCDEHALVNIYPCPFSERGDAMAGLAVCFIGWRPCIKNHRLTTDGRYGYIIGEHSAVCERLSSIRRRVGKLLNASNVRIISPLDAQVLRGVCVFDVGLYGERTV